MDQLHRELSEPVLEDEERLLKAEDGEAMESLSEVDSASGGGSEVGSLPGSSSSPQHGEEQYETADSDHSEGGKGRKRKLGPFSRDRDSGG